MKTKLEDNFFLYLMIILILILEVFFTFSMFKIKINTYKNFNGFVIKDNLINVMINSKDLKLLNSNKYIYYNNKKIKFEIMSVERNVIKGYHSVNLKCNSYNKLVNDLYSFSVFDKKIIFFKIFDVIWEGCILKE